MSTFKVQIKHRFSSSYRDGFKTETEAKEYACKAISDDYVSHDYMTGEYWIYEIEDDGTVKRVDRHHYLG